MAGIVLRSLFRVSTIHFLCNLRDLHPSAVAVSSPVNADSQWIWNMSLWLIRDSFDDSVWIPYGWLQSLTAPIKARISTSARFCISNPTYKLIGLDIFFLLCFVTWSSMSHDLILSFVRDFESLDKFGPNGPFQSNDLLGSLFRLIRNSRCMICAHILQCGAAINAFEEGLIW